MVVIIRMLTKAIFFDRDGTLNVDIGYLHEFEKFEWIDGAIDAIKFCNENNFLAIVITNQSGIARGFYTEDDVKKLHQKINEELKKFDAHIDDFFYCPHHVKGIVKEYNFDCDCRKPKPKLIDDACTKYNIDKKKSLMVGDKLIDVECANNAGIRGILFEGKNIFDCLKKSLSN